MNNKNRLKEGRFFQKLTQIHLSRLSGINPTRISLLENGWIQPRGDEIIKLSEILKLKPDEIFSGGMK